MHDSLRAERNQQTRQEHLTRYDEPDRELGGRTTAYGGSFEPGPAWGRRLATAMDQAQGTERITQPTNAERYRLVGEPQVAQDLPSAARDITLGFVQAAESLLPRRGRQPPATTGDGPRRLPVDQFYQTLPPGTRATQMPGIVQAECIICLRAFNDGTILAELTCQHMYHIECIANWMWDHRPCPVCRQDANVKFHVKYRTPPEANDTTQALPASADQRAISTPPQPLASNPTTPRELQLAIYDEQRMA